MPDSNSKKRCILVMAKPPIPGHVKTRLVAALGERGACDVYKQMLRHCLEQLYQPDRWALQLWGAGAAENRAWQAAGIDCARFDYHEQCGGSLGERMQHAFETAFQNYQQVLIVGTDCPGVDSTYAQSSFSALSADEPVVIGPANDGGYVLLGMQGQCRNIFEDIAWSTESVLAQTRATLREQQLRWQELDEQIDIDTVDDLRSLPNHLAAVITSNLNQ
jgi:rSAM/selenodomain-associated transferase 1